MGNEGHRAAELTVEAYNRMADSYFAETRDRDLQADYALFFGHLGGPGPFDLLDLGCGPGRDLRYFAEQGHRVLGIDGATQFVEMARAYSGCAVWRQDLRKLRLPHVHFDGVFASASLFHVPAEDLPRVLMQVRAALKPGGVFFALNPRGQDEQGFMGDRFCIYHRLSTWRKLVRAAGFLELTHGYRPRGLPRLRQQWLATTWRKPG